MKKNIILLLSALFLISCAGHKQKMGGSKMKVHITPMPHLVHFSLDRVEELGLTKDQVSDIKKIEKEKHPKGAKIAKNIMKGERLLKRASIKGKSYKEVMSIFNDLAENRQKMTKLKADALFEMKSILNEKQWKQVAGIYEVEQGYIIGPDKFHRVKHVNPVPNYMMMIKKSDEITLTKEQSKKIEKWKKDKHPKMAKLIGEVVALEKDLYYTAFKAKKKSFLMKKFAKIAQLRKEVVQNKTKCRDYVMDVLTEDQWKSLRRK